MTGRAGTHPPGSVRKTTASRAVSPFAVSTAATAVSALVAWYVVSDTAVPAPWGLGVPLVLAGAIAGAWGGARSTHAVWEPAVPPVVVALFAALMSGNLGDSTSVGFDVMLLLELLVLWIGPLVVAFTVTRRRQLHRAAALGSLPAGPGSSPLSRELDRATAGGKAATVLRVYVADAEGEAHLQADTASLTVHGYELQSIERTPGAGGTGLAAGALVDLVSPGGAVTSDAYINGEIRATFHSPEADPVARDLPDEGRRTTGCMVAIALIPVTFAAALLVLGVVQGIDRAAWARFVTEHSSADGLLLLALWIVLLVVGWVLAMLVVDRVRRWRGRG